MTKRGVLVGAVLLLSCSGANPILETLVSEFQVAPDSAELIELHCNTSLQGGFPADLSGWAIQTGAGIALIDSGVVLETESSYVVIDRTNTAGTFSLDDSAGFVALLRPGGDTFELVRYPGDAGADRYETWTPPSGMSACLHCWTWGWPDPILFLDWYIDSSPTPGYENDDGEAQICGTVRDRNLNPVEEAEVRISGTDGYETFVSRPTFEGTFQFHVGWGTFLVTAAKDGYLPGAYPESVTVHVDQEVHNIDIILYPLGVEESPAARQPEHTRGRTLLLDVLGRRVADAEQADGTTGFAPGVYFLRSADGSGRPAVRKVVVQR